MIYQYQCPKCLKVMEEYRRVADRNNCPKCAECEVKTTKQLIIPDINTGAGDRIPGLCKSLPGKPVYVKNKHHFRELCKERNAGTPVNL